MRETLCGCCSESTGDDRPDLVLAVAAVRCVPCLDAGCDVWDGVCQRPDVRPPMPADCLWDDTEVES